MLRPFDFVMIGVLIAGASWTFKVKHDSELALDRVRKIEKQIASEREEIDLLKADWALVTSPQRLQKLAKKYSDQLQLQELDAGQIATSNNLPRIKIPEQKIEDFAVDESADGIAPADPDRESITGSLVDELDVDGSEPTFAPIEEGQDQ